MTLQLMWLKWASTNLSQQPTFQAILSIGKVLERHYCHQKGNAFQNNFKSGGANSKAAKAPNSFIKSVIISAG